jgi:FADH2 O2-dependent halogenase
VPQRDVIILGSGLAGSVIAACLARAGLDVLVVDAARHPRFAIGESTIPYTSIMSRLIGERYDVPEIKHLSGFTSVHEHVSANCGKKRNFGFIYHTPHQPHDPAHTNQFPISPNTHAEVHFLRADVDHWLIKVAQRYGADLLEDTRVGDVEVDPGGVRLQLDDGGELECKFLIDASGFRSPLVRKFNLREEPSRLRTHSRSIFTHMKGVIPFEDTLPVRNLHGNPSPWSEGTLHHIFPGGWMWVIPFNNFPGATSDLCSVGISYDPRIYPKPDAAPEEEFTQFCADFPDVAPQFARASAIRPWVSTGRLQYSSTQTVGYRWCLTAHAAGFIDALFSRGMQNTMSVAHSLIAEVIDAVRDDDFSVSRFQHVQDLEQGLLDINDDLVANAYTSFRDWELWNAWFRIWETNQVLSTTVLGDVYSRYVKHHDVSQLEPLITLEPQGAIPSYLPAREMIAKASAYLQDVQYGRREPSEAAEEIFELLGAVDFIPPLFGLAQRSNRWYDVKLIDIVRTAVWARTQAPPEIGRLFSDGLGSLFAQEFGYQLRNRLARVSARSRQRR